LDNSNNFPHYQNGVAYSNHLTKIYFYPNKSLYSFKAEFLNRCTGGPRPSSRPWSSFGGPQGFLYFSKNDNFKHKFHENEKKSTLLGTKAA